MKANQPIGVFDSGVGGISVLRVIRDRMPYEDVVYFADIARIPYGPRKKETIIRYSHEDAAHLVDCGIKALVVACNTSTVSALDLLRARYPEMPIIGVVEPGARLAAAATKNGHIALTATAGTVASGVHERLIRSLRPGTKITGIPSPLFVSLAEEGWMDGPAAEAVARQYLEPAFAVPAAERPDCLLLGCTHFPFLERPIRKVVGPDITFVDPAAATVDDLQKALAERGLVRTKTAGGHGVYSFHVTAGPEHFARIGGLFLNMDLRPEDIVTVPPGAF